MSNLIVFSGFTLIRNYKVLKHRLMNIKSKNRFTLIRNYKVLKHSQCLAELKVSFTLIRNYKVLKLNTESIAFF